MRTLVRISAPGGGTDSSPGLQPGVPVTNHEKPRTGTRNHRSMQPRPGGTIHSSHRPTADTSTPPWPVFLPQLPRPKTTGVPYGKKISPAPGWLQP